jgi:hypothetical protein
MTVVNTEDSAATIKLSAEGDIAGWVRFYKNVTDTDNITDIAVVSGKKASIFARIIVPAGTPNGTYRGIISVSKTAANYTGNEGESGSSVAQKIDREVTVEVSDAENISFDASIIPESYDLNRGNVLRIRIIYDNRSNIMINPQTAIKIKQGENVIYSAIFPYPDNQPKVSPNSLYEIPALEIPTSNLETGKYEAVLAISQEDKYSIEKNFTFSIGTVMAAAATSEPANKDYFSAYYWISALAIGAALLVIFRFRSRRNRKFEGSIDIKSLSQK